MKYIKNFNENLIAKTPQELADERDEIQDFCNNSLAYLLDIDYKTDVSFGQGTKYGYDYVVSTYLDDDMTPFNWIDIRDIFIPFITLLDKKYTLFNINLGSGSEPAFLGKDKNISVKFEDNTWKHFSINDLISDLVIDKKISIIHIRVKPNI